MVRFTIGSNAAQPNKTKPGGFFKPPTVRSQPDSPVTAPSDQFVPSTPSPKQESKAPLSLDSLTGAKAAALSALPSTAAAALQEVWSEVDSTSHGHLLGLLERGVLGESHAEKTVIENLQNLTRERRASGLDGEELTHQTIDLLSQHSVYQGDRYSCGPASMQVKMAKENPALLTYLIDDLTDSDAQAEFGEEQLKLNPRSTETDGSGRELLDRVLQNALMSYAGRSRGEYNVVTDQHGSDTVKGLRHMEVAELVKAIDGEEKVVFHQRTASWKPFRSLMWEQPKGKPLIVGASWNDQDHILTYLGLEGDDALYFDTQTGKEGKMPKDDFAFKVQFAVFSEAQMEGIEVPEELMESTRRHTTDT